MAAGGSSQVTGAQGAAPQRGSAIKKSLKALTGGHSKVDIAKSAGQALRPPEADIKHPISNSTGKLRDVPMKPSNAWGVSTIKTDSGDPQKAALQQSARSGLPPAPPGGKINIMA